MLIFRYLGGREQVPLGCHRSREADGHSFRPDFLEKSLHLTFDVLMISILSSFPQVKRSPSEAVLLTRGRFYLPGGTGRCQKTVSISQFGQGAPMASVGGSQGCLSTSCSAWDGPTKKHLAHDANGDETWGPGHIPSQCSLNFCSCVTIRFWSLHTMGHVPVLRQ